MHVYHICKYEWKLYWIAIDHNFNKKKDTMNPSEEKESLSSENGGNDVRTEEDDVENMLRERLRLKLVVYIILMEDAYMV